MRLRDTYPTSAFRFGGPRPILCIPYLDGFELLYLTPGSQPFGWLTVRVERAAGGCILDVRRRKRPRPERFVLVIMPVFFVVVLALLVHAQGARQAFFLVPMVAVFLIGVAILAFVERRQEWHLLNVLAELFPEMAEHPEDSGPVSRHITRSSNASLDL